MQKICPSDVRSRLDDTPDGRSYNHKSMDCELVKKCESSLCRHPYTNKFSSTASKPSFLIVRHHSCKNLHVEIRYKHLMCHLMCTAKQIYNSGKDGRGMSLWWALKLLPYESSCVTCEAGNDSMLVALTGTKCFTLFCPLSFLYLLLSSLFALPSSVLSLPSSVLSLFLCSRSSSFCYPQLP